MARYKVGIEEKGGTKDEGLSNEVGGRRETKGKVDEDNDEGDSKGTQLKHDHTEERHGG